MDLSSLLPLKEANISGSGRLTTRNKLRLGETAGDGIQDGYLGSAVITLIKTIKNNQFLVGHNLS